MASIYNFGSYNPAQVDRQRTQNRLAQMQMQQAESEMQRQNALQQAMGNLYTQEPVTYRQVTDRNALMPGPGGQQSGGRGRPSMDQIKRGTKEVQVGTRRQFNPEALDKVMQLDPGTGAKIMERRQSMAEAQRAQEDREAVVFANMLDQVEQLPPEQRQAGYDRMRQYAESRLGLDVSDMPAEYDPVRAKMMRAFAAATGEYDPPEAQGGDMPAAVREAMFITGGDEDAARAYLREQNRDRSGNTQRARRIQQTMDVYGVDRRTAQGLIDGIIETETDPVSGNTYLVNKIDGTARRLDYQDSSQTQSVNEQVASQIGDENTLWNSTEGVPGAEGAITEAYQRTVGQIPGMEGGEETQETVQNRQLFRLAQGDLIRSLSINPRFPVAEMQRIQRETDIEPSIFDSRDALKDRMRQLDRYLRNRLKNERRAAQNRDLPVETQQNAAAAAKDIANFLEILGVPRKGQQRNRQNNGQQQMRGPVGERRQNRQDGQQQGENDYALPVGHVEDGYRYQGGDPGNPDNWKKTEGSR